MPVPAQAETARPLVRSLSDIEQRTNAGLHKRLRRANTPAALAAGVAVRVPDPAPQPNIVALDDEAAEAVAPKPTRRKAGRLIRVSVMVAIDDGSGEEEEAPVAKRRGRLSRIARA